MNAEPPKEWFEIVGRGLERHNTVATGIVEYYPVCFVIREAGNHVRGGLHGSLWANGYSSDRCGSIELCAGTGSGIELIAAAEEYARSKGSVASYLQTGSFEARPLYEKLGYRVYAELNDHPVKGRDRFYMSKWSSAANLLRPRTRQFGFKACVHSGSFWSPFIFANTLHWIASHRCRDWHKSIRPSFDCPPAS